MVERAFVYGDLLFESMLMLNGEVLNIENHYKRLISSANVLKFELPQSFSLKFFSETLFNEISNSKLFDKLNCRVRFILYRDSNGFYLPDEHVTKFIVETFELPKDWELQSKKIKKVGVYTAQTKAIGPLSNLKTGNALVYVMAKIWAKENQYDEALILNQNNHIIETASANIFWIKNNITYTVPLSEGCIAGVSRQVYINKLILENNPAVEEICTLQKLQNADKIFMTNAASGISELKL
jgi:branched-chain amino acid aminotransferase